MKTFSAYWSPALGSALRAALSGSNETYSMSLVGDDATAAIAAVNQGIDSHLEACFVPARGDRFDREERAFTAVDAGPYWKKGDRVVHTVALACSVSPESLPVLIRRLLESGDKIGLASSICGTLGIELV